MIKSFKSKTFCLFTLILEETTKKYTDAVISF